MATLNKLPTTMLNKLPTTSLHKLPTTTLNKLPTTPGPYMQKSPTQTELLFKLNLATSSFSN